MRKKAQIWGYDLTIALIIFLIGIIAAYTYAINFLNEAQETLDELTYDGNSISSLILSEGSPEDWTLNNIEIPGILTGKKINQTKLNSFYELSKEDYEKLKKLLHTKYEFYFNFTNMKAFDNSIEGIGKLVENPQNLIRIERFTIYENKPIKFVLYMWN